MYSKVHEIRARQNTVWNRIPCDPDVTVIEATVLLKGYNNSGL